MSRAGWYVIQVRTGQEQAMAQLIQRASSGAEAAGEQQLLEECFTPLFETRRKYQGEWQPVTKQLLPGYLVAVTSSPEALAAKLRAMPEFTRMLSVGESFVPLNEAERGWIDEFTSRGQRVVPMSMAVKTGDALVVTFGPLKGREGMIVRVNRHKCLATVELSIGGKRVSTTVGLGVLSGQAEQPATAGQARQAGQAEQAVQNDTSQ